MFIYDFVIMVFFFFLKIMDGARTWYRKPNIDRIIMIHVKEAEKKMIRN